MGDVTQLVQAASNGDVKALEALFVQVYGELKRLARKQLASASGSTLNTTGLVHEAYLKLARPEGLNLASRTHFFALAAKAMRQIVIDHARVRMAAKRGGPNAQAVELDETVGGEALGPEALLQLDRALSELQVDEPKLAALVELRYFAGLSMAEIAELQQISDRTLSRDWRRAKAHLYDAIYPKTSE